MMIERNIHLLIIVWGLLFLSCNSKSPQIYIDMGYSSMDTTGVVDSNTFDFSEGKKEFIIPYKESKGVKIIAVKVNGVGLEMIFDTGCSGTLISIAGANYLYQKGLLTENDFLGISKSMIADGSIVENMVINLKEVIIADQIFCPNVEATVSKNIDAPLLLGNEILNRTESYTIDNINRTIIFKLK